MSVEHIYTSSNNTFLPWHIWVYTHGTERDIEIHSSLSLTEEETQEKEMLYMRWLEDQKIIKYERVTDGITDHLQEWIWD